MTPEQLFWFIPVASILALFFAWYFFRNMMKESEGNETMKAIAAYVRQGAMAYLRQQYKVVLIVFLVLCLFFAFLAYVLHVQNPWVPFAFLSGGFFSGLAGFIGMKTATYASARTAAAAQRSLNCGLRVAFRSGAVLGLAVVGLGLLDISLWYIVLDKFVSGVTPEQKIVVITTTMLTFGMGADLYESYCVAILATAALGASAFYLMPDMQLKAVFAPMLIAAVGIVLSIIGIFLVQTKEGANMKQLLNALGKGVNISAILIAMFTFIILYVLGIKNWLGLSFSVITGLLAGIVVGQVTEYYTSHTYKPTRRISKSGETGPATVIISGIGVGLFSTAIPVITIGVATIVAFLCAINFDVTNMLAAENLSLGLYGVAIAAVGMLSTLGITLATDAYGPIADNAGGNAQMSGLDPIVRKRTDALDALGNTTAATGKGFAIGSAALTTLALLASYLEEIKISLQHVGQKVLEIPGQGPVEVANATIIDLMNYFQVNLMNPKVLVGLFIGSMMTFLFCGLTMNAVGRAAQSMVEEVRRQFREIKGILTGEATPDYARCVAISTKGAQREMLLPSLLAIIVPVLTGLIFGVGGVMGLLVGGLASGFVLAIFMANAGGAWDNAKKYVEEGNYGGKGSDCHKATVVGDTVGDPFKDTSGPSLNTLIKLMSMVAIVMAGFTVAYSLL